MECLVTGGAGFIGSNVTNRLIELGHNVFVVDNLSEGKVSNIHKDAIFFNMDICDRVQMDYLFNRHNFDVIFHLAAMPRVQKSIAKPYISNEINITGTLNLLILAKEYSVGRFVYSSSSSVYGDQSSLPLKEDMKPNPMSPYALQKLTGEEYCRLFYDIYGLETISLRYFNVYGAKQDPAGPYACMIPKFILKIMNDKQPTIFGDGEVTRDFCLDGESKVLMSDLTWKNIKDIEAGDSVVSFDEKSIYGTRKFRIKKVEAISSYISKNVVEIEIDGQTIICTSNHPWLTDRGEFHDADWMRRKLSRNFPKLRKFSDPVTYKKTKEFKEGYIVGSLDGDGYVFKKKYNNADIYHVGLSVTDIEFANRFAKYSSFIKWNRSVRHHSYPGSKPLNTVLSCKKSTFKWAMDLKSNPKWGSYEFCRGWMSGMFDSEGEKSSTPNLRLSNKDSKTCKRIRSILSKFGFNWSERKRIDGLIIFSVIGGSQEHVRFFATFKPSISRKLANLNNRGVRGKIKRVNGIKKIKKQKVYNLQIEDTHTFIADGFLCHNTSVIDVVEANILAGFTKKSIFGQAFNIGNGNNKSVNYVTKIINKIIGKEIQPIYGDPVIEPKHTLADITRSETILGWTPKISLEAGLELTYDYFKKREKNG